MIEKALKKENRGESEKLITENLHGSIIQEKITLDRNLLSISLFDSEERQRRLCRWKQKDFHLLVSTVMIKTLNIYMALTVYLPWI